MYLMLALLGGCGDGSGGATEATDTAPPPARPSVHPDDYVLPVVHGMDAKLQVLPCTSCHGPNLEGDLGPRCGDCHDRSAIGGDWTKDCTWCHGDPIAGTPAPPEGIHDNVDAATGSFPAHRAHTEDTALHRAYACTACHLLPGSALSRGHVLRDDDTPGVAEVFPDHEPSTYVDGTCTTACHGADFDRGTVVNDTHEVACGD